MGILALIPERAAYTLYARGEIDSHATAPGRGTYIKFTDGSTVLLFYKWSRSRRVYIVREAGLLRNYRPVKLPGIKGPVGILGKFRGRRVDLLRRAYFNLERINGFEAYRYGSRFWQRVSCLIDDYDGRRTGAIKSNLLELSRRYALDSAPAFQKEEDDQIL
jgi:hypothetical protein